MRRSAWVAGAAAALLVGSGCARDTVIVERGASVSDIGRPVISGSREVLNRIQQTSTDATIAIAVADQSCEWPIIRLNPDNRARPLCVPAGQKHSSVKPIDTRALLPTIRLIDSLAAYLSKVDEVLGTEPDSSGAELAAALADAQNIVDIANGLFGGPDTLIVNGEQKAAAVGLVSLLGDLARTRKQAEALVLIEQQNAEVGATIDRLDRDLQNWTTLGLMSDLDTIESAFTIRHAHMREDLARERARNPAARVPDAELDTFLRAWSDARSKRAAGAKLPSELRKALAAFREAHVQYVNIIENKNLTPENRAAMARAARINLSRALAAVAGVIRAFL